MDTSPWDIADSFRLHEAACLIAGVMPLSKRVPDREELPAASIPAYVKLGSAYVLWVTYHDKPEDPKCPKATMLKGLPVDGSEIPTLPEFQPLKKLTGEFVSRDELRRWIEAMGIKSAYSFAPVSVSGAEQVEPASPEIEKYRLLWRAVRFDENRVKASLTRLQRFLPTGISEDAIRDVKLLALRAELAQIACRKDWLGLQMGVAKQHAAEIRFTVEEMAESRQPLDADEGVKRAAEIKLANEEIDALISERQAVSVALPVVPAVASGSLAPLKQRNQERRILELLKMRGYEPLKLPLRVHGKRGTKAEIKEPALKETKLFTDKSFELAWQRLRDAGDIAEG